MRQYFAIRFRQKRTTRHMRLRCSTLTKICLKLKIVILAKNWLKLTNGCPFIVNLKFKVLVNIAETFAKLIPILTMVTGFCLMRAVAFDFDEKKLNFLNVKFQISEILAHLFWTPFQYTFDCDLFGQYSTSTTFIKYLTPDRYPVQKICPPKKTGSMHFKQ